MKKLTLDSHVKDLYQTVIGHDALAKVLLQLNISEKAIMIKNRLDRVPQRQRQHLKH